jgi:hypothetical protein
MVAGWFNFVPLLVRVVLGLILVVAGLSKLWVQPPALPGVQASMTDQMLPPGSLGRYVLSGGEIVLGAWLMIGVLRRTSLSFTFVLLLGFTVVLVGELMSDDPRWCGCIAVITPDQTISPRQELMQSILRNLVMMTASAWLLFSPRRIHRTPVESGHGDGADGVLRPAPGEQHIHQQDGP